MNLKHDRRGIIGVIRTAQHRVEIGQDVSNIVVEMRIAVYRLKTGIARRSKYLFRITVEHHTCSRKLLCLIVPGLSIACQLVLLILIEDTAAGKLAFQTGPGTMQAYFCCRKR